MKAVLVFAAVAAMAFAPMGARAQTGLAGSVCSLDSECMSRFCAADGTCVATTCGMPSNKGGLGSSAPAGFCSTMQKYNPDRLCLFGFGKCTKAECCDTVSCDAGVLDSQKATFCPGQLVFAGSLLCPNGACTPGSCCVKTTCESAGGVPVSRRPTFCGAGLMFNGGGVCAAGSGKCTSTDCCVLDTRTCGVAYSDPKTVPAGGTCPAPSVLVPTRIFDANDPDQRGNCCETTTCATGVPDAQKTEYCKNNPGTVFSGTPTCPTGACTTSDCCQSTKGFCDGDATLDPNTKACTCPTGKSYLIGYGCVCSPGTELVNGNCEPCNYGYYSASLTVAQKCAACPANQPYTGKKGSSNSEDCVNYCNQVLVGNSVPGGNFQGACSNYGTCTSLTGDPLTGGAFSCTCTSSWMGYGPTITNNCDAPTTLLRLRVLAASGVTLPSDLKVLVSDTPIVAGTDPAYALPAPTLACELGGNPTTPTAPTCSKGGAGAMAAALGDAADTRKFVNTKVKLSTNYVAPAGTVPLNIGWACSDGTNVDSSSDFVTILPGPGNANGAQTLVCTAIFSNAELPAPIKLELSKDSEMPAPTDANLAAMLTFAQGTAPICTLDAKDAATAKLQPVCEAPLVNGQSGTLGVSNIDMERYTLSWACGPEGQTAVAVSTTPDGDATTPVLPSAGQAALICVATFQIKATQIVLTVTNVAKADYTLSAMQPGMNEACVAKIPAGSSGATASLSCPVSNMGSGVKTNLTTDADLTQYLVSYSCKESTGTAVTGTKSVLVESTRNGVPAASATVCEVTITALPPLLQVKITNTAAAPKFKVFASQDASNTCEAPSDGTLVDCLLEEGMMPGVKTSLTPRGLDAGKYAVTWKCTGSAAGAFEQVPYSNAATVVLNSNPNVGGGVVVCEGIVSTSSMPVNLMITPSTADVGTALTNANAETRVRQSHQSKACAAVKPMGKATPPVCENEGLNPEKGKRTTLSTDNIDLSAYKVMWSCNYNGDVPTTIIAAGVATAQTMGDGAVVVCSANVSPKPPIIKLQYTGPVKPDVDWSLSARQSTQGRACTVSVPKGTDTPTAVAPQCDAKTQPFGPARATALTTLGLDYTRWSVAWACIREDDKTPVQLIDTVSANGVNVPNSKTLIVDKDANVGGQSVVCTAAVAPRGDVLALKATGDLPPSGWTLTAKQPTQSSACSVPSTAALAGGPPVCDPGVIALAAGTPVQLGTTGLPDSSSVSWDCVIGAGATAGTAVAVTQGNAGAASVTPPEIAGVYTVCTATVRASSAPYLQIVGVPGFVFSATQATKDKPMCVATDNTAVVCDGAAANFAKTILFVDNVPDKQIARFSCVLGSKVVVPVAKTSGTSALVTTPVATETMICTLSIVDKPPILTVTSNVPTVLTAVTEKGATCTSSVETNTLICDSGDGIGQLPAEMRVNLAQKGFEDAGYYRWACASSSADIVRIGDWQKPDATATITLPKDGGALTCSLVFSKTEPKLGRLRSRLFML